jgi:hypothetical protein
VHSFSSKRFVSALIVLCAVSASPSHAQENPPDLPAQIELLETRVRFESNGDSRKEVHTRVHINNELGTRQFARLSFDYNRSFQQIDFPLIRVTHEGGGTIDILSSAISDQPNPAVVNAPAYQDVRVKSVRILGLAPNDVLEYRVVTTTSSPPFAPGFYISHDFARDGIVSQEFFEIDVPAASKAAPITSRLAEIYETKESNEDARGRVLYQWKRPPAPGPDERDSERHPEPSPPNTSIQSDIVLTTLDWTDLLQPLKHALKKSEEPDSRVKGEADRLTRSATAPKTKLKVLYDFVSQKIKTVDLPLGATAFRFRDPVDVVSSGYGAPEDKSILFSSLASSIGIDAAPALILSSQNMLLHGANPSALTSILNVARFADSAVWLDPAVEVAPFGVVRSELRAKPALLVSPPNSVQFFERVSTELPFAANQRVSVNAAITADGALSVKVKYTMRGDNELLLRVAFHQSPKEKWNEVAQLLALSDGFRGKITSVTASDPYATKTPFTVEYQITQPKFVDWSKKPVRIPALLPQLALPDPPAKPASGAATTAIELGTPLDVETHLTLHLPAGTVVRTPTATSVVRDYATFASQYQATAGTVTASRHLNFLSRQVPADRAADYNAFLRAIQNDESQEFLLEAPK